MSVTVMSKPVVAQSLAAILLPIMGVVFVAFLVIGIAMPVLPLHVHEGLGLGTFVVGLVAGIQFAASLVSRPWAGNFSDSRGAKRGVVVGLLAAAASHQVRFSFVKVISAVWVPGLGSALGSVGFGAVMTFIALLFANRGLPHGWLAYSAYAVAFILARIFFSHVADTLGGAKVALVCAVIEAAGQALIWLSIRPEMALAGAALTGFGFSLVYPGFGVEAVRRVPAQSRGLAMGAYTAFLDLAQGLASPALGLIATGGRLNVVFLASAVTVLGATVVAWWLMAHPATLEGCPQ